MKPLARLSRVVFSRYFSSGVVSATGTLALGLLGYAIAGMGYALSLASGALMVCFADNPAPVGLKAVELSFASIAGALCFAAVWGTARHPWLQLAVVPVLGFLAGLVTLWGKRAVGIAFSLLFITIITLGIPPPANSAALAAGSVLLLLGALAYTAYALLLGRVLRGRTKQQALAEVIDAIGAYMRWQGQAYARAAAQTPDDDGAQAAMLQGAVNDALQSARDLVLREGRAPRDALWTHMLLLTLDLFEAQLAAHNDASPLHEAFDGSDVLQALGLGLRQNAEALETLALALLHDRELHVRTPRPQRWDGLQQQAAAWLGERTESELRQARAMLEAQLHSLRQVDALVGALHQAYALRNAPPAFPELPDARLFVSPWRYQPRQVLAHLRLGSPVFRHAVRLALALGCALLLSRLMFSHQEHAYWIGLTIAVILRPNYGVTRQRIRERLLGTVAGCLLAAAFLALHPGLYWMLAGIFLALALARTFVTTNYRFTAMAGSVLALLLAYLLRENSPFLAEQRVLDTAIGAALAWGFSHLLPRWEYLDAPQQLRDLLAALSRYAAVALERAPHEEREFRLARKQLFDTLAGITGLHGRMLEEPRGRRRAPQHLAQLITHAYLLASQLASVRLLRAQLEPQGRMGDPQWAQMQACRDQVLHGLSSQRGVDAVAPAGTPPSWLPDEDPLLTRLHLIGSEAAQIGQLRQRIQRELHGAPTAAQQPA